MYATMHVMHVSTVCRQGSISLPVHVAYINVCLFASLAGLIVATVKLDKYRYA